MKVGAVSRAANLEALKHTPTRKGGLVSMPAGAASRLGSQARLLNSAGSTCE
jgi:hypothetical protein